jgi:hypothetical protein
MLAMGCLFHILALVVLLAAPLGASPDDGAHTGKFHRPIRLDPTESMPFAVRS